MSHSYLSLIGWLGKSKLIREQLLFSVKESREWELFGCLREMNSRQREQ